MTRQPKRAVPPICWVCDRKLAMGGWQYATVTDPLGHEHPVHVSCVPDPEPTARPKQ